MPQDYTGSATSTTDLVDDLDNETNTGAASSGGSFSNGATSSTGVLNQAQDKVGQVADQVKDKVGPMVSQAQQKTGEIAGQVQQQATSRIEQQKQHAAEGLGSVAESLRQTGQQLRDNDQSVVTQYMAQYGEAAANQVEQVSNYLRERDVNQIVHEVEDFARREPALFIGGAFLLGLLGARFLKTSSPASTSSGSSTAGSMSTLALPTTSYQAPSYGASNYQTPAFNTSASESDDAGDVNIGFDAGSSAV
ncbi:MAG: hypothetical protein JO316_07935 [Abitibacteriaceae bacterium]|nr:hypothetical protein [Abditibacteriaceae bacterium]MBV9865262.1 hypothetical protein [Abditibacteriaceae bacterium]